MIWLQIFQVLENNNLYIFDNAFEWERHAPASSHPFFARPGAPAPSALVAGYYEADARVLNVIAP